MQSLNTLVNNVATQENPLSVLRTFLDSQASLEAAKQVDKLRFVGYVLELGFDTAKIITSDPYKIAVGGIPRGSFLIMVPNNSSNIPPHFTLIRVTGVATTPLSSQVQQTYFELHKKSMPELDIWTQGELQWGALDCDVLGMFYADPSDLRKLSFSGDVNNVVSPHRYSVYSPDEALLKLIVNGTVKEKNQFQLGKLRTMENQLSDVAAPKIPVNISMEDFKGCRTAMFGKTRLGKSNVVKLIAQGMIEANSNDKSVGQLIFDINGEYANDNNQDGSKSLRSAYADQCKVYALTKRDTTPSEPLRLNFYEQPGTSLEILGSLLQQDNQNSHYITGFYNTELPTIEDIQNLPFDQRTRPIRLIQIYWAILNKAGFLANESRLKSLGLNSSNAKNFNPHFSEALRKAAYEFEGIKEIPDHPSTLDQLEQELEIIADFRKANPKHKALISSKSKKPIFGPNELALLEFLKPTGSGPSILRPYFRYHSPDAGNFLNEILELLDDGKTVILDLGNANDKIRRYFSEMLSVAIFNHQEKKFVNNKLNNDYIQLYFEEAHNLFPVNDKDFTGVYVRFAKEGAKFHIGMVYSTQSPSTINKELLAQTENFFVGHLSSIDETKSLSRVQVAFSGVENDILKAKTPGYMRMLTMSNRFVIPVQAKKFEANVQTNGSVGEM
ncbi:hypothetical protein COD13_29045 [Priestia megaterium]|uniref:ATP-binding protein n=1 Tax=Priestia megaterium TaxID=1404 RepID=UPI000BFE9DA5|nr:DUF87 domain-containing protein [Priestia megaterium]PGT49818.1 hypothetical protein COD13_29045 [Priestia megaterium]